MANTPLLTNKSMDGTIGVSQTSLAYATDNTSATDQKQPLVRFLGPLIAAQTISAQSVSYHAGVQQSNTNSVFQAWCCIGVWRPGTGALVGMLHDNIAIGAMAASGTGETAGSNSVISASVTAQDGDILVLEVWRNNSAQTMATSYTDTVYYDGTTEDSTTSNAAYLLFANDVALYVAPTKSLPPIRRPFRSFRVRH